MSKEVILDILSTLSSFLPVIAFIYNYRNLDQISKIIGAFFVTAALFDLILWLIPTWGIRNNVPAVHIFVLINIAFFGVIYYLAFFSKLLKIVTLVLFGIAFIISAYFAITSTYDYPAESNTASGVVFIILSVVYFYQLLNRQEFIHIEKQGLFWFNAGVLFFFSINIFLFMLFNKIPKAQQPSVYLINNITNIIANALYTIGLLCKPQKST